MNNSVSSHRSVCWYVRSAAVAVTVIGLICFLLARHEHLTAGGANSSLLIWVAVLTAIGAIIQGASLLPKLWKLKYVPIVCYLAVLVIFLNAEMVYISQVFVDIDGLSFAPAWLAAVVCWIATTVLTVVSMVMYERSRKERLADNK